MRIHAAKALCNILRVGSDGVDETYGRLVIDTLIATLNDVSFDIRLDAAMVLVRIGAAAGAVVPVLTDAVNKIDLLLWVRVHVVNALYRVDNSKTEIVIPVLIEALNDKLLPARIEAAEGLREIGTPEALEAIADFVPFKGEAR